MKLDGNTAPPGMLTTKRFQLRTVSLGDRPDSRSHEHWLPSNGEVLPVQASSARLNAAVSAVT